MVYDMWEMTVVYHSAVFSDYYDDAFLDVLRVGFYPQNQEKP
mgnify:CR=1 FL=1